MPYARFVLPTLIAVTAAAGARAQPAYVIDPSTGQPVPVVQQYSQPAYQQQPQSYGQQQYVQQPQYAQPQQQQSAGRGLFNLSGRGQTYVYQPQYQQQYQPQDQQSYQQQYQQPYQPQPQYQQQYQEQEPQPRQSYVLQYRPPPQQQQAYAPYGNAYAYAYAPAAQGYTLDAGDKLRVVVFGQAGISGDYLVDASGQVTLPLVGSVPARGRTTKALAEMIAERLKQGYVRDPHVTVSIASYRPFFILGEVTTPGQYPYVPNMTAENAVAIAGGFSPRAKKGSVELTRNMGGQQVHARVPLSYPLQPGDTVVVGERWF